MMKRLLIIFLILSGCNTPSKSGKFDGKWKFIDEMACLNKADVIKLIGVLNKCEINDEL